MGTEESLKNKGRFVELLGSFRNIVFGVLVGALVLFPSFYFISTDAGEEINSNDVLGVKTSTVPKLVFSYSSKTTLKQEIPNMAPRSVSMFKFNGEYTSEQEIVNEFGRFLKWPVENGRGVVTQCYSVEHQAIDIADERFPNLVAAYDGTVSFVGCQSGDCPAMGEGAKGGEGLAWIVVIDHGNGLSTLYAHLEDIMVEEGDDVKVGDLIAKMGQTGSATGVHVHFMVLVHGSIIDTLNPALFLDRPIDRTCAQMPS